MKTRHPIQLSIFPNPARLTIPAGTRCDPASNMPPAADPHYWVRASRKMDAATRTACRSTGILVSRSMILTGVHA